MFAQASKKFMVFFLALFVAAPTVGMTMSAEADAGTLSSSRKKGKRTKKTRRSGRKVSKRSTARRSTTRTVTRGRRGRTTTTRTVSTRRRVDDRRVVHRRSTRYASPRRRTTIVRSRRPVRRSRTTVVHHHHHRDPVYRSSASAPAQPSRSVRGKRIGPDFFMMGNLGVSGLSSQALADDSMPGVDFNVVLGGKGDLLGVDLGFNVGGYRLDSSGPANQADFSKVGMTLDLKIQPTFSIFEPYVSVGGGVYTLNDEIENISSGGAGLRLGTGIGLRVHQSVGLTAGYLYETIGFADDFGSFGAQTETLSAGLKIYF